MDKEGGKRRRACELEKKRGSTQKLVKLFNFYSKRLSIPQTSVIWQLTVQHAGVNLGPSCLKYSIYVYYYI